MVFRKLFHIILKRMWNSSSKKRNFCVLSSNQRHKVNSRLGNQRSADGRAQRGTKTNHKFKNNEIKCACV